METILKTESGLLKTGQGKIKGIIINSHSSGTLKIIDGTAPSVVAVGTLTSAGACAPATHATSKITSSGAMVAGTHAVSVLTGDAVVAGNVVVIGAITYTFVSAVADLTSAYKVLVGVNLTATLLNLKNAINGSGMGTTCSYGTVAHTQVRAVASNATTVTVRGRVPGTSLNTVETTGTALRTVWADTTLGGGTGASDPGVATTNATVTIGTTVYTVVDELSEAYGATAIPYQVKKGAAEANMLDNLKSAINETAGKGTVYSTGTVAHPSVVATTNTDTTQVIVARAPGEDYDDLPTTETMANTVWEDTTLGGGTGDSNPGVTTDEATITIGDQVYTVVNALSESYGATAIPNEVLWETAEANFLDNLKLAVNASGTPGSKYSTGTIANQYVTATTNANDNQVFSARLLGASQNSVATTTTLANYAFGATTLASGTLADGKIMFDTITLGAAERYLELNDAEFIRGLYITVGGTSCNYTALLN
jgi:hypothetical protein